MRYAICSLALAVALFLPWMEGAEAAGRGDADCSGAVNVYDALWVLHYDVGNVRFLPCPEAADTDLSGRVDSIDALIDLQVDAGLVIY